ncbi:hypothetical protein ACE38W_14540 [Chitinophaga sp. Hz27]|uniref:hypothetical protein n=1 Tax=Chitinophaga sp. Hz27 TaxID=3347169 RepID=UPI0035D632D1
MQIAVVVLPFTDKYTSVFHRLGETLELSDERYEELHKRGKVTAMAAETKVSGSPDTCSPHVHKPKKDKSKKKDDI